MGQRRAMGLVGEGTARSSSQAGATTTVFAPIPIRRSPASSLAFAVIGDFGVGVRKDTPTRRQQQVANALRRMVDSEGVRFLLTTGDNIYARVRVFGVAVGGTGDEDDDWFFTYFQPYRYVINRIPVYPSIGNHDADETEERDDRAQVEDNFYLHERIKSEEAAGRASFGPGLFYRFRYGSDIEFVCIDTSKESFFSGAPAVRIPEALGVRRAVVSRGGAAPDMADSVRASSRLQRRPAASQHTLDGETAAAVRAIERACHVHRPRAQLSALADRRFRSLRDRRGRQGASIAARWFRRGAHRLLGHRLPLPACANRGAPHDGARDRGAGRSRRHAGGHRAVRSGRRSLVSGPVEIEV